MHPDFHQQILNALADEGLLDGPAVKRVRAQTKVPQLSAAAVRALAHAGLDAGADRLDINALNAGLAKSGLNSSQRFQLKTELAAAGLID